MKLPLWFKSKSGKYEPFPFELLTTYPNGRQGFEFQEVIRRNKLWTFVCTNMEHFEYSVKLDSYILKE
jgi:hypothetical protein